ncbi:hypothetical protein PMIT1313_00163 [Prochlorococcus marinus str. MIT 1313]|uniref:hypothetical protein n=1 Tax=Prochlorococcus TaxID=1218 RepID=UPI0007B369EB|nr:hypothetical protein [Prochlorococcus marinus]KZR72078.1 hypothetical protein PMIT1313_00163 [Prochlorococcus marinus str. MIT 1313]KZR74638.1 hypothetical protein PMIT1318_00381 [Prochlorococcus marinus str. MIT 1318]
MVDVIFTENFSWLQLASLLASPPQFFSEQKGFFVAHSCDSKTLTLLRHIAVDGVAAIFSRGVVVLCVIAVVAVDAA